MKFGPTSANCCPARFVFAAQLPKLFPARGREMQGHLSDPLVAQTTAFRNGSLRGAYPIIAARPLGLDCGSEGS